MKRLLDIVLVLASAPVLIPVIVAVAIAVRLRLGSPVFFRQHRAGLYGRRFRILKFRTMLDAKQADGRVLPDAERLTEFGGQLRSTSLDELPELWNVLRGDMSLVGPRPLLDEYLPLYTSEQARRHHVRPGITGWAQINGRNAISWDDRFSLDLWYVDNRSLALDFWILLRTVSEVFRRRGIAADNEVSMPRFTGPSVK